MQATYLCVFLLCLGAAIAQSPPKCCIPDKWESEFGLMEGIHPKFSRRVMQVGAVMKVSYDGLGQRSASSGIIFGANQTSVRSIADYKRQKAYTIVNGRCTVRPLRKKFNKFCVPNAYSKYMGRSYFGIGRDTLNFDTWGIGIKTRRMQGFVSLGLTTTCYPVSESIIGSVRKAEFMLAGGFTKMTPGIKDPSVFTPPSSCRRVDEEADFDHDAAEVHFTVLTSLSEEPEGAMDVNDIF